MLKFNMRSAAFAAPAAILAIALMSAGCSTKVTRNPDEVKDLSGGWSVLDAKQVAKSVTDSALKGGWIARHYRTSKNPPVVTVGEIKNLTHEHIDTQMVVNEIQANLINSGEVDFVAARSDRTSARDERKEQDQYARDDTRKKERQEIGSDYILDGSVSAIVDAEGRESYVTYQFDMSLTEVETQRIVWKSTPPVTITKHVENKKIRP